jgi:hypothetical protein
MQNFKYIEYPKVPDELIAEIHKSVNNNPDLFPRKSKIYTIHNCTQPLYDFAHQYFDQTYSVQAQRIIGGHPMVVHFDARRDFTNNYIIDCGGDAVYTNFYSEQQQLIEQHKIEPFRWHQLDVRTLHNVSGTVAGRNRIALCVFQQR